MQSTKIKQPVIKRLPFLLGLAFSTIFSSCGKDKGSTTPGGGTTIITVDADVTILAAQTNQVIQGFGCATVFTPPGYKPLYKR